MSCVYDEIDKVDYKMHIYHTLHFIVQFSCYFILRERIRRIQYNMDNKKYNLLIHPLVQIILHISLAIFMYIIIETIIYSFKIS